MLGHTVASGAGYGRFWRPGILSRLVAMSSREKTRGNTKTAGAAVIAKGTTDITVPYYYYYIIYQYESCDIIFN